MTYSFDPIKTIAGIASLLLIFGVIPFTPVAVGLILVAALCTFEITWDAR